LIVTFPSYHVLYKVPCCHQEVVYVTAKEVARSVEGINSALCPDDTVCKVIW